MRRGRIIIFIILILIIGLVVAVFAAQTLLRPSTAQKQPVNVEVFVAAQNIPQGGKITKDLLTTITLPQDKVTAVEYTVDEQADLLNNKVAKFPLDQGVVITSSMVTDASQAVTIAGPQWAALIPPGMTAVSIPTTRLSLDAYAVNDGAHVNVNACFLFVDVDPSFQSITPNNTGVITGTGFPQNALPILSLGVAKSDVPQGRLELDPSLQQPFYVTPSEPQRPRLVCQTVLQDVVVMKLGNFPLTATQSQASQQQTQQQQQQGAAPAPDIVTLIVAPQDAITLSYMVYTNAQIMMTLRNPSDQSRQATEAATLQFLLSQYNIPVPAKLPYAIQPRIDVLTAPSLPNDVVTVKPQQ
ncbi:MAG TPA: SAF domain-containing protein [Anaerolineales bacterium]|nr:SAF domain-containing protein [Anaerolineales bacterium]